MAHLLLAILSLLALATGAHGDRFTALVELEKSLEIEAELAHHLHGYVDKEEERLGKLRELAENMAEHSKKVLKDPVKYIGNPVNAFQMVKRFTIDWEEVMDTLIHSNNTSEFSNLVASITDDFPDYDDYTGSITALLRLQDTYALDPDNIAHGRLPGVAFSPTMSAHDCFELGRVSYNEQDHYHTIQWMQEALVRLNEEEEKTVYENQVLDYLSYALYVQGNVYHAKNMTERWLAIDPDHVRAQNNLRYFEQMIKEQEGERKKGDEGDPPQDPTIQNYRFANEVDQYRASEEFSTYEALCRGEDIIPIKNTHKLTCQYRFWHPVFYIDPLREETMSFEPWVAVYHQVMNDKEIEKIKELATPRLARATVHNSVTGKLEHAKYRISKSGWLRDDEDPMVAKVSQKCGALTNLSLTTVEELQVVNYGIGGHYEPHYDFSRREERTAFENWRGNRILTVIFYMSDVEAGGGTVFINAGIKLWPEKGSCAVWYNLFPSGEGDLRTRHAACPVLTGSKWVANKWFHERDQEFNRRCDLTP